jgi:hypothetical protein
LQPPDDLNKVIRCKLCGLPMHWFQINKQVGYWLHRGEDVKVCAAKNPMMNGKPLIAHSVTFYKKIYVLWKEKMEEIARQNSGKRQKLSKL